MAKIEALFTKSLTFLSLILNFPPKTSIFIYFCLKDMPHSVQFAPISGQNLPFFGKLYNSVQSKDIFMISKVWSRIMTILSCLVISRPNLTSRLSSTTPGSKMSGKSWKMVMQNSANHAQDYHHCDQLKKSWKMMYDTWAQLLNFKLRHTL